MHLAKEVGLQPKGFESKLPFALKLLHQINLSQINIFPPRQTARIENKVYPTSRHSYWVTGLLVQQFFLVCLTLYFAKAPQTISRNYYFIVAGIELLFFFYQIGINLQKLIVVLLSSRIQNSNAPLLIYTYRPTVTQLLQREGWHKQRISWTSLRLLAEITAIRNQLSSQLIGKNSFPFFALFSNAPPLIIIELFIKITPLHCFSNLDTCIYDSFNWK